LKRKVHSQRKNLKNVHVQALKKQEFSEELIDHEQEDPPKDEDVLASINTSIVNTSIAFSIGPNVVVLHGVDNKKVGEELRCTDLPIGPLNLYNFVCGVWDLVEKTGD